MGLSHDKRPDPSRVLLLADYRIPSHQRRAARLRQQPAPAAGGWTGAAQARATTARALRPASAPTTSGAVRVTHFAEGADARGVVRRLRICGRLADVCAELERLAAAEQGQAAAVRRA